MADMTENLKTTEVFVLVGFYSDRSACKLFGVYELLRAAEDRQTILEAAGSVYTTRVVKMAVNVATPQEVF